jgi:hypothetical protein
MLALTSPTSDPFSVFPMAYMYVYEMATKISEEQDVSVFRVDDITLARKSVRRLLTVNNKPIQFHIPENGILHT